MSRRRVIFCRFPTRSRSGFSKSHKNVYEDKCCIERELLRKDLIYFAFETPTEKIDSHYLKR